MADKALAYRVRHSDDGESDPLRRLPLAAGTREDTGKRRLLLC